MGQWHSKVRFHNLDEGQPWLEHCHWHSPALHWPKEEEEKEETSSQNKQCHPQLRLKNPSVRTGNRLTSANLHWWIQMIPSTSKWNLWMKLRNRKQETKSTMPWVQRRPRAHRDNWVLTWIHKCKLHWVRFICALCQMPNSTPQTELFKSFNLWSHQVNSQIHFMGWDHMWIMIMNNTHFVKTQIPTTAMILRLYTFLHLWWRGKALHLGIFGDSDQNGW